MDRQIVPNIIIPNKAFLIGSIFGFNAGRKLENKNLQPYRDENLKDEMPYVGPLLEFVCDKCGRFYAYDNPNELPEETMECSNSSCDNIIILYGVGEPDRWKVGQISFQ